MVIKSSRVEYETMKYSRAAHVFLSLCFVRLLDFIETKYPDICIFSNSLKNLISEVSGPNSVIDVNRNRMS